LGITKERERGREGERERILNSTLHTANAPELLNYY
jgi:hypothetical protein